MYLLLYVSALSSGRFRKQEEEDIGGIDSQMSPYFFWQFKKLRRARSHRFINLRNLSIWTVSEVVFFQSLKNRSNLNENIHKDLQISLVKDEFKRAKEKYSLKLEMHPNSLARQLTNRCTQGYVELTRSLWTEERTIAKHPETD